MKTLSVEVPDDVFERAQQRAAQLGTSLPQQCVEFVQRFGIEHEADQRDAARGRLEELFRTIHGFRTGKKISREELHDRGRVH